MRDFDIVLCQFFFEFTNTSVVSAKIGRGEWSFGEDFTKQVIILVFGNSTVF